MKFPDEVLEFRENISFRFSDKEQTLELVFEKMRKCWEEPGLGVRVRGVGRKASRCKEWWADLSHYLLSAPCLHLYHGLNTTTPTSWKHGEGHLDSIHKLSFGSMQSFTNTRHCYPQLDA